MEVNIIKANPIKHKPRVCAYVRVSTSQLDQLNSFENQKEYWDRRFKNDDSVEYVGLFTDEGISGNKTKQRKGFMEVIKLAKLGEIDTVYTKSFSRFSRNETDGLESIALLANYGVNVFFEKENLDSSDPSKKFLLNILAKVSEDNIESTSKNIKMSLRNRIRNGKIISGRCYGYNAIYDKALREYVYSKNTEESEIVKLIFNLYASGVGMDRISKRLYELKINSPTGKEIWSSTAIKYVLSNEKYIGNVRLQKYYSHNFKKVKNDNDREETPQVLVENNHEPIIDTGLFNKVQSILHSKTKAGKPNIIRAFTGKVICGDCGHGYIHRVHYYGGERKYDFYDCGYKIKKKLIGSCQSRMIKEKCLYTLFNECFNEALKIKPEHSKLAELEIQKEKLAISEKNLNTMYAKRYISDNDFNSQIEKLIGDITELETQIEIEKRKEVILEPLSKDDSIDVAIIKYLDKVIVKDFTVTFCFINGIQIKRSY